MNHSPRHPLGYLVAFSLGVICATCIFLGLRTPEKEVRVITAAPAADPETTPQTEPASLPPLPQRKAPVTVNPAPKTRIAEQPPELPAFAEIQPPPEPSGEKPGGTPLPTMIPRVAPVSANSTAVLVRNGGRISGGVRLEGPVPREYPLPLDPVCARNFQGPKTTRFYRLGKDRGLADVVVVLVSGVEPARWEPPAEPFVLTETGCLFEPYVSAVQAGQIVQIINREKVLHNLHLTSRFNAN